MDRVKFIGLDLAWAPHNATGGAVLDAGGHLLELKLLGSDAEILAFVEAHAGMGPAVIGIDAPLRVPNAVGRRPAEAELARRYQRAHAGAHPANRTLLAGPDGTLRGERLRAALEARGFDHDPVFGVQEAVRRVLEVYPHPALVELFGLPRILKYKSKGQGRAVQDAEWGRLTQALRSLETATPPLTGLTTWLDTDVTALRGRALKAHEDQTDAVICAYVALYVWHWGPARAQVFGSLEGGYILVPRGEEGSASPRV